jgi:hypothetical protein
MFLGACITGKTLTGVDDQFDNGLYIWPKPEMETERWRYVTVKECRAALRQPVPSEWDPRAKLKKGFKTSIDALRKELVSSISEVADFDKENVQAMEKMTIKAVNIWLEFGMQRCRILVRQCRSSRKVDSKADKALKDLMDLVVVPQLKRYGKSDGQDLDTEETIKGCDGETIIIS